MRVGGFYLAGVEFTFEGLGSVINNLEAWGDRVVAAADDAIVEAAAEGASLVEANAPVLTGRLRASVTHDHLKWGLAVIAVGGGIPHTRPQEARTKFFNRSISVVQVGLLDRVADTIRKRAF